MLQKEWLKRAKPGWALKWAQNIKPIKSNIEVLKESVKYGSKIFTEPDLKMRSKSGKEYRVYAKALHNIFLAMKGFRIFERFGFNLPKQAKGTTGATLIQNYDEWLFEPQVFDWVNSKNGNTLSEYKPLGELIYLLKNNIDILLE